MIQPEEASLIRADGTPIVRAVIRFADRAALLFAGDLFALATYERYRPLWRELTNARNQRDRFREQVCWKALNRIRFDCCPPTGEPLALEQLLIIDDGKILQFRATLIDQTTFDAQVARRRSYWFRAG